MKRSVNNIALRCFSLLLVTVLIIATSVCGNVASVAEATDNGFVQNKYFYDFESGKFPDNHTVPSSYSVEAAPDSSHGEYSLRHSWSDDYRSYKINMAFTAGHTYYFSAYYYYLDVNCEADGYFAWFPVCLGDKEITYASVSESAPAGVWRRFCLTFTAESDAEYLKFVGGKCDFYLDDIYITELSEADSSVYVSTDLSDLETIERLPVLAGKNASVEYCYDEEKQKNVAVAQLTNGLNSSCSVFVPYSLKVGTDYMLTIEYKATAWSCISYDSPANWAGAAATSFSGDSAWHTKTMTFTPTNENTDYLRFGTNQTNGAVLYISQIILREVKENYNTETYQYYDFEDTVLYKTNGNSVATELVKDNDNKITTAFSIAQPETASKFSDIYTKLDCSLVAGQKYKISFDYSGCGLLKLLANSCEWEPHQIITKNAPVTDVALLYADYHGLKSTEGWQHYELEFTAEDSWSGMLFMCQNRMDVSSLPQDIAGKAQLYIDNISITNAYTEFAEDFEDGELFDGGVASSDNFTAAASPAEGQGDFSLKHSLSASNEYYRIRNPRLLKGHTYTVTFKYYAPSGESSVATSYFRLDRRYADDSYIEKQGITSVKDCWKGVSFVFTPETENEYLSLLCRDEMYIDDFRIADITENSGIYKQDFSDDLNSATLLENNANSSVKLVYDEESDKNIAEITFTGTNEGSHGVVKVPFALEAGEIYRVRLVYKAELWHGIYFGGSFSGEDGLKSSSWTTKTYYITGNGNADLFGIGTNKGDTVLLISEIHIEKSLGAGDLDNNGEIAARDTVLLRKQLLGVYDADIFECAADVNEDSFIDILDFIRLKKLISGSLTTPTSVTLTLYGEDSYGVTWNTSDLPGEPVVQISAGDEFNSSNFTEFKADVSCETSYKSDGTEITYYVSKAVITGLTTGETYTYRCYDKKYSSYSDNFTFTVSDRDADSFTFIHVSDSQSTADSSVDPNNEGIGSGAYYAKTMSAMEQTGANPDFILHTGDIVEWSKYESYWQNMLDANRKYFAATPVMPISGNHEATYRNGTKEIYKHFNLDITEQDTTLGVYYYFDYGNVRFIMLDTNRLNKNELTQEQYNWLVNTLESNTQKWTIVSMHNPMYSVGKWGANTSLNTISLALRNQLSDLFAEYGVDLVLQGHDHTYSKTYPIGIDGAVNKELEYEEINGISYCTNANGVIYAMNGPAGNQSRSVVSADEGFYELYGNSKQSSWAEIEVSDSLLTVKVYYYSNGVPALWNSYGIKK